MQGSLCQDFAQQPVADSDDAAVMVINHGDITDIAHVRIPFHHIEIEDADSDAVFAGFNVFFIGIVDFPQSMWFEVVEDGAAYSGYLVRDGFHSARSVDRIVATFAGWLHKQSGNTENN